MSIELAHRIARAWARLVRCHELFDRHLRPWEHTDPTPADRESVTLVG